ncbi:PstS family phosphate ABC transporter substrate-binding protein [uncultured Acetobacteroides sp.]|uniref:PstS family phosphate ABC transporter substrate-binding protein n=1 Tax=uncultured Acetobacteroides sp. TaxID=1760811 RepID=UPI0029F584C7|nr:PstS family phosphate ABC transporter substrate-binding protein [uncultured Acetobacteroides sp.]
MYNRLILAASALLISVAAFGQTVKVMGSDTALPLTQKEAEAFIKTNKNASIAVTGGGSGVGIAALIEGTTDIAMASRPLKFYEKIKIQAAKINYKQVEIAKDALSVIVHPSNKVSKLNRQQLEDIFTGKITNWKQVGGSDMRIIVYTRETSSGTYEFFKDHVMGKKNFARTALSMSATGAVIQSISQTKGAIGYVGLAYLNKKVKQIAVSFNGKGYVAPTVQNALSGKYPITRPLYYFYDIKREKVVMPFIHFVLSEKGQQLVKEDGYIPVK